MLSIPTLLFSLSALSLVAAAPAAAQDHSKDCLEDGVTYGSLCKLNGQNFDNSTVLTDTFSFSAAGHVGLSNAINYFTMDFQPTSGDSAKFHNFYPVELTPGFLQHDPSSNIVFHADNVKIPCGLSGKSKLNLVSHQHYGAQYGASVLLKQYGPFEVNSPAC